MLVGNSKTTQIIPVGGREAPPLPSTHDVFCQSWIYRPKCRCQICVFPMMCALNKWFFFSKCLLRWFLGLPTERPEMSAGLICKRIQLFFWLSVLLWVFEASFWKRFAGFLLSLKASAARWVWEQFKTGRPKPKQNECIWKIHVVTQSSFDYCWECVDDSMMSTWYHFGGQSV